MYGNKFMLTPREFLNFFSFETKVKCFKNKLPEMNSFHGYMLLKL